MSEERYRRYAETVRIFHGLQPEEVKDILKQGRTIDFRSGQTVFHEGQLGSNLFIVLKGEIAIFRKNKMIAKCVMGDAFGEMAVLNRAPRSATASALTDARLFTLDEGDMNVILDQKLAVRVLLNIIHVLSERLEAANGWIADLRQRRRPPRD